MQFNTRGVLFPIGICMLLSACCPNPKTYQSRIAQTGPFASEAQCKQMTAINTSLALRNIRSTAQVDCATHCAQKECKGTLRYTVDYGCTLGANGRHHGYYKIENLKCECEDEDG